MQLPTLSTSLPNAEISWQVCDVCVTTGRLEFRRKDWNWLLIRSLRSNRGWRIDDRRWRIARPVCGQNKRLTTLTAETR